jgi:hypothetical protein
MRRSTGEYMSYLEQRIAALEADNEAMRITLGAENDRLERNERLEREVLELRALLDRRGTENAALSRAISCSICARHTITPDWCCRKPGNGGFR